MKEKEHQSVEWKQAWRDEYLKWICGYANAYGGTIYIGTDDDGNVIGIDNAKELLELIPSKITDTMGIIADVNLLYKDGLEYLEIIVDKYPSLISFRGKYYYRSGSTMREITGKELERTLLKTQGRTWDGVPLPKLSVTDLKQDAIQLFKEKSVRRGRLTQEDVNVSDEVLMDNLHLIDENGYLIRAAMLAFYNDPEKWVTGAYVKIGFFDIAFFSNACSLEIKGAESDCRKRKYYPCPESRGMYIDCRCQEIIKQHFHNEQQPIQKNV